MRNVLIALAMVVMGAAAVQPVHEWFAGGDGDTVTLRSDTREDDAVVSSVPEAPVGPGRRLLVSGDADMVWAAGSLARTVLLRRHNGRPPWPGDPPDRGATVDFGVHLPIVDLGEGMLTFDQLQTYTATAAELGYATLSANDHLVWRRPWLDGPAALTSVVGHSGSMTLATTICLVNVRHPVVVAKWLTTMASLTGARVVAGLGPGSSSADYAAVGIPFEQRWARFDEALGAVKALVQGQPTAAGRFYDVSDVRLDPLPARPPEVWFASWGSDRRLQAQAAIADGWLASGYNTTPERFAQTRGRLDGHLVAGGRDPAAFPDMIATMWLYVTPTQREADRMLNDVLGPVLHRGADELATQLPIGPPEHCIDLLRSYADAGARQILLWPVGDPIDQLHRFDTLVRPYATT